MLFRMTYTITTRIYQTNTSTYFTILETGVWHYARGGQWTSVASTPKLTMGDSGTSGILRFKTEDNQEGFFVALGVHNWKPWVDIVTNLEDHDTGVKCLPEYYENGKDIRARAREAQRAEWKATNNQGRVIKAKFKGTEGHDLELDIVIG